MKTLAGYSAYLRIVANKSQGRVKPKGSLCFSDLIVKECPFPFWDDSPTLADWFMPSAYLLPGTTIWKWICFNPYCGGDTPSDTKPYYVTSAEVCRSGTGWKDLVGIILQGHIFLRFVKLRAPHSMHIGLVFSSPALLSQVCVGTRGTKKSPPILSPFLFHSSHMPLLPHEQVCDLYLCGYCHTPDLKRDL